MNRCNYDTKLKNDMMCNSRKIGYYLPLHSPKNSQYTIKELNSYKNFDELKFIHETCNINFPSITNRCFMKTKKCGIRIIILHITTKM
jgi:hypothetical protein